MKVTFHGTGYPPVDSYPAFWLWTLDGGGTCVRGLKSYRFTFQALTNGGGDDLGPATYESSRPWVRWFVHPKLIDPESGATTILDDQIWFVNSQDPGVSGTVDGLGGPRLAQPSSLRIHGVFYTHWGPTPAGLVGIGVGEYGPPAGPETNPTIMGRFVFSFGSKELPVGVGNYCPYPVCL